LREALEEARRGQREDGLPIESVLADASGYIVTRGHNLRVQTGDPAHAEVVCIRNGGRKILGCEPAVVRFAADDCY
jgi:cytosine deaminase